MAESLNRRSLGWNRSDRRPSVVARGDHVASVTQYSVEFMAVGTEWRRRKLAGRRRWHGTEDWTANAPTRIADDHVELARGGNARSGECEPP